MMNFKAEFEKYADLLTDDEKKKIWILEIAEEVDGLYQYEKNKELLSKITNKEQKSMESLCTAIESIYNSKVIKFLSKEENGLILNQEITLKEFEKTLDSFNYVKVQNQIIETMHAGGIAVVVAGSKGLTPQRIHGFILFEAGWCKCQKEFLALIRDIILI